MKNSFYHPFSLQSLSLMSRTESKLHYSVAFILSLKIRDWWGEGKN